MTIKDGKRPETSKEKFDKVGRDGEALQDETTRDLRNDPEVLLMQRYCGKSACTLPYSAHTLKIGMCFCKCREQ